MTDPDRLLAGDVDHLTDPDSPDGLDDGTNGHTPPWGTRTSRRFGRIAEVWYRAYRHGHDVPEEWAEDRLDAAELILARAFAAEGAAVRGVAVAVPELPATPLERALAQARVEAARWHRWRTGRTLVGIGLVVALVANAVMLLV